MCRDLSNGHTYLCNMLQAYLENARTNSRHALPCFIENVSGPRHEDSWFTIILSMWPYPGEDTNALSLYRLLVNEYRHT